MTRAAAGSNGRSRSLLLDWRALLGIAISVGLLWWTFRNEDLGEMAHTIARADMFLLFLATFCATFVFWIRAWRWKALVDPVHRGTSFRSRFAAVSIGFMGNNLLPARIGEFARVYAFSRIEPVPLAASFSTLVMERLFDAVFIVSSLFVAAALPGFPESARPGAMTGAASTLAGLVSFAFLMLFLLVTFPRMTVGAIERVANKVLPFRFRRPLVDALASFLKGVGVLRDVRLLARATAWTIVLWIVNGLSFWFAFEAFGLDLSFTAAIFFQAVIALAVSVPSGPGFFGVFEGAAALVLVELWGRDPTQSKSFAIGFHLAGFIPITIIGLYWAKRIGLTLRTVARTEEAVEEAVEEDVRAGTRPAGPDAAS